MGTALDLRVPRGAIRQPLCIRHLALIAALVHALAEADTRRHGAVDVDTAERGGEGGDPVVAELAGAALALAQAAVLEDEVGDVGVGEGGEAVVGGLVLGPIVLVGVVDHGARQEEEGRVEEVVGELVVAVLKVHGRLFCVRLERPVGCFVRGLHVSRGC